jgi:GntR family transcriptional regulator
VPLNKHSPIPLYYQLVETIREKIRLGELKPGEQIPSERDAAEQYGISRMTVRQAVLYLIREGHLVAQQGLGTFVAAPKLAYDPLHLLSFTEEMMRQGAATTSHVLEQTLITPPAPVAKDLDLPADASATKIVRVRLSHDVPLLLETVYVPTAVCAGLDREDLTTQSLYSLLEDKYNLRLSRTRQTLEAISANEYEADLFGVALGTGMLLVEGVTYLDTDRPAEYYKAIYRGDRFKFELESRREIGVREATSAPRMSVVLR